MRDRHLFALSKLLVMHCIDCRARYSALPGSLFPWAWIGLWCSGQFVLSDATFTLACGRQLDWVQMGISGRDAVSSRLWSFP